MLTNQNGYILDIDLQRANMSGGAKKLGDVAQIPTCEIDFVNAIENTSTTHCSVRAIAQAVILRRSPFGQVGAGMNTSRKYSANLIFFQQLFHLSRPRVKTHVATHHRDELPAGYLLG